MCVFPTCFRLLNNTSQALCFSPPLLVGTLMPMWSVSILSTSMGECLRCLPPLMLTGKDYAELLPSPLVLTMMSLSRATTSRWHGIMRCIYRRECRSFLSKQGRSLPGDTPCLCFCFHRQIGMRPLPSLSLPYTILTALPPLRGMHFVHATLGDPGASRGILLALLVLLTRDSMSCLRTHLSVTLPFKGLNAEPFLLLVPVADKRIIARPFSLTFDPSEKASS